MNKLLVLTEERKRASVNVIQGLLDRYNKEIPMITLSIKKKIDIYGKNHPAYHTANVPLLIRLLLVDILILYKHFLSTLSITEQNLFARLIYAQLYEFIEKVPNILGEKYRKHLYKLPFNSILSDELNKVTKVVNDYKKKNHEKFQVIRNNISAHKDIDGILQVDMINVLDFNWVMVAYKDLIPIITQFHEYEKKLTWIAENGHKSPSALAKLLSNKT